MYSFKLSNSIQFLTKSRKYNHFFHLPPGEQPTPLVRARLHHQRQQSPTISTTTAAATITTIVVIPRASRLRASGRGTARGRAQGLLRGRHPGGRASIPARPAGLAAAAVAAPRRDRADTGDDARPRARQRRLQRRRRAELARGQGGAASRQGRSLDSRGQCHSAEAEKGI
ncbi:unnamed protein product [Trichogramma brassicae]|uniref:Uncharacterized protein n=1 Tax=Trichogramma brassicae TaxID=86971 RepID=A0A6H5J5T3_9HYME|nr:unnamed protein product [Trichogramma brassicae]